eukprot:COSAG01_NODE_18312_length_1085_cov_1.336714_1_plen_43_part_10
MLASVTAKVAANMSAIKHAGATGGVSLWLLRADVDKDVVERLD